ncbi:MAG: hypothetical protein ACOYMU_04485 [Phycisphaerales bacterium]|jgi:hypothetical protein
MKNLKSFRLNSFQTGAVCLLFASLTSLASAGQPTQSSGQMFQDTQNDLFDNSLGNLDITNVWVENTATDITFSVTTREFQSWTKYMIFLETTIGGGTGTNAWSRPIDLSGAQIDYFVGSWVDASSNNSQFVANNFLGWDWASATTFSNVQSGNTVSWTMSLASMNLFVGSVISFDVATTGGGNDPGVDHLSRDVLATTGWGNPSVAGAFMTYTVVPGPGAFALLGLAGLVSRRRR